MIDIQLNIILKEKNLILGSNDENKFIISKTYISF